MLTVKQFTRSVAAYCRMFDRKKYSTNKKVLLRERKRHTVRSVESARYAALSPDERGRGGRGYGVTPSSPGQGEYPEVPLHLDLDGVLPPTWTWDGIVPPPWTWDGVPPHLDLGWGSPSVWTWDGVPPISWMGTSHLDLGWGTPPPPIQTWDGVPPTSPVGRMTVTLNSF